MLRRGAFWLAASFAVPFCLSLAASAQDVYILDILGHPERFYNRTVTIIGQVQSVQAIQSGTSRGQYTIFDDSTPNPLTVKSESLPKIGKIFTITGTLIADPARVNVPVLMEESRSSPGSSLITTAILIAAAVVFLILLVLLLRYLSRSKTAGHGAPVIRPGQGGAATPDMGKTIRVAPAAEPASAKTQVYLNLGATIVVEKGADAGKEYPLHMLVIGVGRPGARKNDIELTDGTVSKEQATIRYDNIRKEFTLVNESQTNPTRVNGADVAEPVVLADGAGIEMGKTVLRFKKG